MPERDLSDPDHVALRALDDLHVDRARAKTFGRILRFQSTFISAAVGRWLRAGLGGPATPGTVEGALAWNGGPWPDVLTLERSDGDREYIPYLCVLTGELVEALGLTVQFLDDTAEQLGTNDLGNRCYHVAEGLRAALARARETSPKGGNE